MVSSWGLAAAVARADPVPIGPCDDRRYFILDRERRPVAASREQSETFCMDGCLVARTRIGESTIITTWFAGFDDGARDALPRPFETWVVFDGRDDGMYRYASWGEAEAGHDELVERYTALSEARP